MNWKFLTEASLTKKTLLATGAMVGAVVLFVGTLSLVAVGIASAVVGPSTPSDTPAAAPGDTKTPAGASSGAPGKERGTSGRPRISDSTSASKPKPI